MSNSNTNLQTQSSNALHNAIMEAGSKDHPPMLEMGKLLPVAEGSSETTTERYMENYKNVSQDIRDQLNNQQRHWYDNQRAVNVAGARENVEQADWKDDTDDESKDQGIKAYYMYMAQIQEVTPDPVDNSRPIFDDEPLHKVTACKTVLKAKTRMTRQPIDVPISSRQPKHNVNQSAATSSKKTITTDSIVKKSRHTTRKLYEQVSKTCRWWYPKNAIRTANILEHKTPRCSTVSNTPLSSNSFTARTMKFGNDQIAPILGYGDLVQGTITIKWVYYVEWLNHNLFSIGQFCDADLEVAFRKSTSRPTTPNPICLMAKATSSQAWLWHRRLSYLNFNTINLLSKNNIVNGLPKLKFVKDHLCSSCELGKAKRKSFHTKTTPSSKRWLQLLHMDLCGPMRVESINGKKYVLIIVDDYSRYTWTHFLRSKDETPRVLIDFLTLVQRGLHAQVTIVQTDKGTEFLNKTLHGYFAKEEIRHKTSTARTHKQNGIVERRNRTLIKVAQTMLSAAKGFFVHQG
ncbi:retrovirus-related pol polyprotein from transposon TNT 1-94 [Tanacetum coccineum]|uniref:Retrovirus-related pol polyprotein from transposon TNT 1-94 n=1 Tax=Tanacetum coccineum TaxID=301880 RepID=A0ABQ4WC83_9ASTR